MSINIKNPVERKMAEVEQIWLEASVNSDTRLFVWRTPQESDRMLYGFFALQQEPDSQYCTQDLFISFQASYQTSYQYCQAIEQEFIERYEATEIEGDKWSYTDLIPCYRVEQLNTLFSDFITHHDQFFRNLVIVLMPSQISYIDGFNAWLREGLTTPIAERVRFILVDTIEEPCWQSLIDDYPVQSALIEMNIDEMELMRQVLNESPTTDGTDMLRFRQLMTDTFIALSKDNPKQLAVRAQQAIDIATKNNWFEQLVVMYSMLAGAYLKSADIPHAVANYQLSQQATTNILDESSQRFLHTQSLFGEAGAWFVGKDYLAASKCYVAAARLAQQIPQPLWIIEGYRVAGLCLLEAKNNDWLNDTADYYYQAFMAGIALPTEERAQSTFMFIFQDLMRFVDNARVEKLTHLSEVYQTRQTQIIELTEKKQKSQSTVPSTEQIEEYDSILDQNMVALFNEILQARETLVSEANTHFRMLISFARRYLHPYWSIQPEISHPLDEDRQNWLTPMSYTSAIDESEKTPEEFYILLTDIFKLDVQTRENKEEQV